MRFPRALSPGRLMSAGLALLVVAAALYVLPSEQYIFLPDVAHPVAPLVSAPGAKEPHDGGGFYFVDVIVRKASLLERLLPHLRDGATLVPASAVIPPGTSDAERRKQDLREMSRSQSVAAAVALRALGYRVATKPLGVLIAAVGADAPAHGKLETGDVVLSVDGKPVLTPGAMRTLIQRRHPGETVRFGLRRDHAARTVTVRTISGGPREHGRPIVGVLVDQAADIRLPIPVRIDAGGVGGPSAGLAFALDVMEELGRDVDRGYRVAATGEIRLDGGVGAIGGVKQKTIGARRTHVDVFLVPAGDNADEAKRYAHGLRIIPVQSFRQALRALATLPPKH